MVPEALRSLSHTKKHTEVWGLKSINTSSLFPPMKGSHHPVSQMWKLRQRRAKASPLWSQCTNNKHVTSPHHFQRCQGLPGPFAVTYTVPLMERHPLYASTSTLPLKLDQSAWFRLRSRPFSPALMAAPRVSNYNKEGRSQDSLAISQDQISFNSFNTGYVQIAGEGLVVGSRNLCFLILPLPNC